MEIFPSQPVDNPLWERLRQLDDAQGWPGHLTLRALIARWFFVNLELQIMSLHPQMTLHNLRHGEAVASNAAEIAKKAGLLEKSPDALNSEEIYYLLAACYLHDIGMGLIRKEQDRRKATESDVSIHTIIRRQHHIRSDEHVRQFARELYLNEGESTILGLLCRAHRASERLGQPPYVNQVGVFNRQIRLPLLAAILRVADELDLDYSRAPSAVRMLWDATGWFDHIARLHWLKHYYTLRTSIEVVTGTETVVRPRITIRVPSGPQKDYYVSRISALIHDHLRGELDSVSGPFLPGFVFGDAVIEIVENPDLIRRFLRHNEIRILIVDDDEDYVENVRELMLRDFRTVTAITSPLEAFAAVTLHPEAFDVAIVDLNMPGLRGEDSTVDTGIVLIRNFSTQSRDLAIIANTGDRGPDSEQRARDAGAHVCRVKYATSTDIEVEKEELVASIAEALDLIGYQVEPADSGSPA
jgi:CheY-like chemotaxis protein